MHASRSGIRLLDTTAHSGLLASKLLIPASVHFSGLSAPGRPLITSDGSTLLAVLAAGPVASDRDDGFGSRGSASLPAGGR